MRLREGEAGEGREKREEKRMKRVTEGGEIGEEEEKKEEARERRRPGGVLERGEGEGRSGDDGKEDDRNEGELVRKEGNIEIVRGEKMKKERREVKGGRGEGKKVKVEDRKERRRKGGRERGEWKQKERG